MRGVFLIISAKEFKTFKSKSLLEVVAKLLKFSMNHYDLMLSRADFVKGIYEIDVEGFAVPEKSFVNNIVDEHILCKDLVSKVLESVLETRDDDMLLLLDVWKAQGVEIVLGNVELEIMFSAESITRARRKVQNGEGKFLPTSWAVAKRRGLNEELLRVHYGAGDSFE